MEERRRAIEPRDRGLGFHSLGPPELFGFGRACGSLLEVTLGQSEVAEVSDRTGAAAARLALERNRFVVELLRPLQLSDSLSRLPKLVQRTSDSGRIPDLSRDRQTLFRIRDRQFGPDKEAGEVGRDRKNLCTQRGRRGPPPDEGG